MTTRKGRGARTQDLVALWFREHGWPEARDVAAAVGGADILGVLGWAPEVKARRGFEPLKWIRQAVKNALPGQYPAVIFRCDGQGEAAVGDWPVLLRLADFTALLHEANYGERAGRLSGDLLPCTCLTWRVTGLPHATGCPRYTAPRAQRELFKPPEVYGPPHDVLDLS